MNIYDNYIRANNANDVVEYFKGTAFNPKIDYYNGKMPARQIKPKLTDYSEKVYNFIQKIVDFKSQYLFGKGVDFENLNPENNIGFEDFVISWEKSKLTNHYVKLATSLFAYGESAELIALNDDGSISHIPLLRNETDFFAFFDNDGTLAAFSNYFTVKELKGKEIVDVPYCQIYTKDFKYTYKDINGWKLSENPEPILKMPVVYYSAKSVVERIKNQQDGYNELANELSDVNSQASYPFLVMIGNAINLLFGGEDLGNKSISERTTAFMDKLNSGMMKGVVLDGDEKADFKILSWDKEPKTLMFELENLKTLMYKFTSVPDISLENLKSITNISGFALQILFLDAEISKSTDFGVFFELKRAINLHKYYAKLNVDVKAVTKSFLPKDQAEIITSLAVATTSGTMSNQTAIAKNPYVTNPESEKTLIEKEKEAQINDIVGESYE